MSHFADRLTEAIRVRGNPVCVGLDPRWESLPMEIRRRHGVEKIAAAFEEFCDRVLDIVAPLVPVVKPQAAFFEACGPEGFAVMQRLLRKARALGLMTILDGKRNDIASTATAYAEAAFGVWGADACTVNPYLGRDAVEPFLASARKVEAGVFVLVRTSNPGARLFQDLLVQEKGEEPRPLYQHVGAAVAGWARENLGACGMGDVGAVVGATYPAELMLLRRQLPEVMFLVPGFGAQGGTAADVKPAFRGDGTGAVVNSSRGILFPFTPDASDWEARIEVATRQTIAAMCVREAIRLAEALLPGEPSAEGQRDPRWQAIIAVGEHISEEPEAVWDFVKTWGAHPQEDLRTAVATCLLEHLLEHHFESIFPRIEQLALANPLFGYTFRQCWKFGQSEEPANSKVFDALRRRLSRLT